MAAGLRLEARGLFWSGWRLTHIAEHLKIPRTTLYGWHKADGWDDAAPTQRVGHYRSPAYQAHQQGKEDGEDCREIDLLGRQIERLARIHKYERSGRETDLNPNIEARNAGPKKKPTKNFLSLRMCRNSRTPSLIRCLTISACGGTTSASARARS
jgi:uncharacterized protein YjcR